MNFVAKQNFNKKHTFERNKKSPKKGKQIKRNYKHIMVHAVAAATKNLKIKRCKEKYCPQKP